MPSNMSTRSKRSSTVDAVTKAASDDSSFEERPTADPTLSDDSSYSDNEPARKKSAAAFPSESSDAGDGELDDTELETGDSPKPKPAKTARKSSSKLNSSKPKGRKGKGGFNIYNRPAPIAEFQAPNPISSPSGLDVMYDLEFTKNDNNSFRLNAVQDQVDGLRDELRNRHDTQSEQRDGFLTAIDVIGRIVWKSSLSTQMGFTMPTLPSRMKTVIFNLTTPSSPTTYVLSKQNSLYSRKVVETRLLLSKVTTLPLLLH
jgi:hypothetical protein